MASPHTGLVQCLQATSTPSPLTFVHATALDLSGLPPPQLAYPRYPSFSDSYALSNRSRLLVWVQDPDILLKITTTQNIILEKNNTTGNRNGTMDENSQIPMVDCSLYTLGILDSEHNYIIRPGDDVACQDGTAPRFPNSVDVNYYQKTQYVSDPASLFNRFQLQKLNMYGFDVRWYQNQNVADLWSGASEQEIDLYTPLRLNCSLLNRGIDIQGLDAVRIENGNLNKAELTNDCFAYQTCYDMLSKTTNPRAIYPWFVETLQGLSKWTPLMYAISNSPRYISSEDVGGDIGVAVFLNNDEGPLKISQHLRLTLYRYYRVSFQLMLDQTNACGGNLAASSGKIGIASSSSSDSNEIEYAFSFLDAVNRLDLVNRLNGSMPQSILVEFVFQARNDPAILSIASTRTIGCGPVVGAFNLTYLKNPTNTIAEGISYHYLAKTMRKLDKDESFYKPSASPGENQTPSPTQQTPSRTPSTTIIIIVAVIIGVMAILITVLVYLWRRRSHAEMERILNAGQNHAMGPSFVKPATRNGRQKGVNDISSAMSKRDEDYHQKRSDPRSFPHHRRTVSEPAKTTGSSVLSETENAVAESTDVYAPPGFSRTDASQFNRRGSAANLDKLKAAAAAAAAAAMDGEESDLQTLKNKLAVMEEEAGGSDETMDV